MTDEPQRDGLPFPQAPEAVELRHLRSFVAVAEELNYTRASERLHISRPALSRQISTLERLVGVQLLNRTTHRVELTVAGEALLEHARLLLGGVDTAIRETQSVGGELVGRVTRLWDPIVDRFNADAGIEDTRAVFEAMHAQFEPPDSVGVMPVSARGVSGLVVSPHGEQTVSILYLHGGAHVLGSAFGFRHLAGAVAAATGTGVLIPDCRLAPEHPFPADVDDSLAAFEWLLDRGIDPADTAIVADSSGAVPAFAALLGRRDRGEPLPGRLALMCPWVDITWPHPYPSPDREQALRLLREWTALYLDGHPVDDPLLNPGEADLTGLPPMLVQACTGDGLLDDARRLTEHAVACGVEAHLELYPSTIHGFHMFWSFLPEAAGALDRVAHFCRTGEPAPAEAEAG